MMKILREGVQLSYDLAGKGEQNFVLIHSTGGNHLLLEEQFKYLSQFGCVLTMDLRGYGESDKPEQNYTIKGFADGVAYLCRENGIKKAIFAGLLIGGNIAIELANTVPGLVSHLILLEPAILIDPSMIWLIQEYIKDLKDPNKKNFIEDLAESLFFSISSDKKQLVLQALREASRQAFASTFEDLLRWNETGSEKIMNCKMPTLYIRSTEPFCSENALRQFCPHLIAGKVVGSGQWITMEVPDQVNAMIKRFLTLYT